MDAAKARQKLKLIRIMVVLTLCFSVLSVGCFAGSKVIKDQTYNSYTRITAATNYETKVASYTSAIRLAPNRTEAYLLLVNVFSEDGIFSQAESDAFLAVYNACHTKLNDQDPDYAVILSKIGFLYINGYTEAATTRLRLALPFLKEANGLLSSESDEKRAVSCYCQIGSFYEDYIWDAGSVREVSVPVMEDLLTQIESTLTDFQSDLSADTVFNSLGFKVAVCDLMYDQRDILAATIPYERVAAILECIYQDLPEETSLQREQTKQLLQTLETNRANYVDMIERAYTRGNNA